MPIDPVGDALVRWFIRAALAAFAVSAFLLCRLRTAADWSATTRLGRITRSWWSFAFLLYAVHVALAFHYYHHWSHADAVERTRQMSGFGEGIYISHAFTIVWGLDVLSWWCWSHYYARRSLWIDRLLYSFMAFILFNGAVIFAEGMIRWVSALTAIALVVWWLYSRWKICRENKSIESCSTQFLPTDQRQR